MLSGAVLKDIETNKEWNLYDSSFIALEGTWHLSYGFKGFQNCRYNIIIIKRNLWQKPCSDAKGFFGGKPLQPQNIYH